MYLESLPITDPMDFVEKVSRPRTNAMRVVPLDELILFAKTGVICNGCLGQSLVEMPSRVFFIALIFRVGSRFQFAR